MPPRLRSGDVLEVEFPKVPSPELFFPRGGFGYLTYVGKDHDKCDAVRVRPGILYERPTITEELFADSYVTFYPAKPALSLGLVTIVRRLAPTAITTCPTLTNDFTYGQANKRTSPTSFALAISITS